MLVSNLINRTPVFRYEFRIGDEFFPERQLPMCPNYLKPDHSFKYSYRKKGSAPIRLTTVVLLTEFLGTPFSSGNQGLLLPSSFFLSNPFQKRERRRGSRKSSVVKVTNRMSRFGRPSDSLNSRDYLLTYRGDTSMLIPELERVAEKYGPYPHRRRWTPEEDEILVQYASRVPEWVIADYLKKTHPPGRTPAAVRVHASELRGRRDGKGEK